MPRAVSQASVTIFDVSGTSGRHDRTQECASELASTGTTRTADDRRTDDNHDDNRSTRAIRQGVEGDGQAG